MPVHARRFLLITGDAALIQRLSALAGLTMSERIYYTHTGEMPQLPALPDGFCLRRMDAAVLDSLSGRIIPSFSWDTPARFLQNGFGWCVMRGDTVAASAFTAAVTPDAADIGVETAEAFRRMGLAKIAAGAVLREIIAQGKTAVWAHAAENTGSMKTALALGFRESHRCMTIRREEPHT